jgi:hypothetical protein
VGQSDSSSSKGSSWFSISNSGASHLLAKNLESLVRNSASSASAGYFLVGSSPENIEWAALGAADVAMGQPRLLQLPIAILHPSADIALSFRSVQ